MNHTKGWPFIIIDQPFDKNEGIMQKKNLISLFVLVLLAMPLAACGGGVGDVQGIEWQ